MGINVNVSTATTPGLLPVEQPDVTGSWDNPMVMVECVIGCSNQITYGDYNEVTIGGYFDICAGMLLEVTVGATVEVITPLAVEVIFPFPGQSILRAIATVPASVAASAMGFPGRAGPQGSAVPGLQYDVVFGDYTEWVQELSYHQTGSTFEYFWYKVFWAESEILEGLDTDAVECSGYAPEGSTIRTLISNSFIVLVAEGGKLSLLAPLVQIASSFASQYKSDDQIQLSSFAEAILSATVSIILMGPNGSSVKLSDDGITVNATNSVYISPSEQQLGGAPTPNSVTPLAAAIISQAAAAASIAQAWAASAKAELLAAGAIETTG